MRCLPPLLSEQLRASSNGYEQLLEALEWRYQLADQVALYWTQLQAKYLGPKEALGDFRDDVEQAARLAYPNTGAEVAGHQGRDTFVAGLRSQELRKWVRQARPQSFVEARTAALQGEACFCTEEGQGVVHAVGAQAPEGPDHLVQIIECILMMLEASGQAAPWRPEGGFRCRELGRDCGASGH